MTTPPTQTPFDDAAHDQHQLELFPLETIAPRGINAEAARASVPPGWWPLVRPLFNANPPACVTKCRLRDGLLELEAVDAPSARPLRSLVKTIQTATGFTCGCCGSVSAVMVHDASGIPLHPVCSSCATRLGGGESVADIARAFFAPDGSAFPRPSGNPFAPPASPSRTVLLVSPTQLRAPVALPPEELRTLIVSIRESMRTTIVGQDESVDRLALLCGLHVGADMPRGARALIVGPSGTGKTSLVSSAREAIAEFGLPWVHADALDLTSPGWGGAPSIGDLLETALRGIDPHSARARRAVVVIDELAHATPAKDAERNVRAVRQELMASLLGLFGGGSVHLGEGTTEWSSKQALVIGMGAFTGLLDLTRTPTQADLIGPLPLELATRIEEIICLRSLSEPVLLQLLRQWPELRALEDVCTHLGHRVVITDEAYRRAARAVVLSPGAATPRSAGGWLVTALRGLLIDAISDPAPRELAVTPDSLPIPPHATANRRDEPPTGSDGWDSTAIPPR